MPCGCRDAYDLGIPYDGIPKGQKVECADCHRQFIEKRIGRNKSPLNDRNTDEW